MKNYDISHGADRDCSPDTQPALPLLRRSWEEKPLPPADVHEAGTPPLRRSWGEKPYYSLDYYLREQFGEKVYRLSLNGGCTCPNRDGRLDTRGCIFCDRGGSGDFAASPSLSITEQIEASKAQVAAKRSCRKFIAYFQAYTNTYGPLKKLRSMFFEAIRHPDIVVLSIATRPDCLPDEVLDLLSELQQIKPVWMELGLQTIHAATSRFIRSGFTLDCFHEAVLKLQRLHIPVIAHVILGLPGETQAQMLQTVDYLGQLGIDGVKLQLLHVLTDTDLYDYYRAHPFPLLTQEEYCDLVIQCIEHLPPGTVIHRLTGDGPGKLLAGPLWSRNKRQVLNQIHRTMKERGSYQGKQYSGPSGRRKTAIRHLDSDNDTQATRRRQRFQGGDSHGRSFDTI